MRPAPWRHLDRYRIVFGEMASPLGATYGAFRIPRPQGGHIDTIIDEMLNVQFPWICVPLTVDLSVGPNWCDMEKIETFSSDKRLDWPFRAPEFV
jgi:hypothetical protein